MLPPFASRVVLPFGLVLTACASSITPDASDAADTAIVADASDVSPPLDAGTDVGTPESSVTDSGVDTSVRDVPSRTDGGVCNGLSPTGPVVAGTCLASSTTMTGAGGTIVDGVYDLTATMFYPGPTGCSGFTPGTTQASIDVEGTTMQTAGQSPGSPPTQTTQSFSVSDNMISFTPICPPTSTPSTATYTATTTMLTLYVVAGGETAVLAFTHR